MARGTTVQSKQRKLRPSSSHLIPGTAEYDRVFNGAAPPVLDDGSPKNTKILTEWRSYVVYHYLKHVEAEKKLGIASKTNDGKYYARLILSPRVPIPQETVDPQGDVIMAAPAKAGPSSPIAPSSTAAPREMIKQPCVAVRRDSSFATRDQQGPSDASSIWTEESKRISDTMSSTKLAHIPCKFRRKHVSLLN